jgi:hypothetical protein
MLLATTFRRWDCALTALPDTLKMENIDMANFAFCQHHWPVMALSMVLACPLKKRSVAS